MINHPIPKMTDPLGKHWRQPPRCRIAITSRWAIMSQATFDNLPAYDRSLPSGVYDGKMWTRTHGGPSVLCWYTPHDTDPKLCKIERRQVLILNPRKRWPK